MLEQEKKKLEERLNELPETTDGDVKGIFEIIKDNYQLLQFFYFESLRYVKRLKGKAKGEIDASESCGTIHKVQGKENKTIIISTAISRRTTSGTYDWIKDNSELINVGVTRAMENLIVVTDRKVIVPFQDTHAKELRVKMLYNLRVGVCFSL